MIGSLLGESVTMNVTVLSNPKPLCKWYHNGTLFKNIIPEKLSDYYHLCSVSIEKLKKNDFGNYRVDVLDSSQHTVAHAEFIVQLKGKSIFFSLKT